MYFPGSRISPSFSPSRYRPDFDSRTTRRALRSPIEAMGSGLFGGPGLGGHGGLERGHFLAGQQAPLAGAHLADLQRAEADAGEAFDFIPELVKHETDLPLDALGEGQ